MMILFMTFQRSLTEAGFQNAEVNVSCHFLIVQSCKMNVFWFIQTTDRIVLVPIGVFAV